MAAIQFNLTPVETCYHLWLQYHVIVLHTGQFKLINEYYYYYK